MAVSIGLAGAGRWATEVHAPSLASCPEIRFSGIWSRSDDAAWSLATRYGVPAYRSYDELLEHCQGVSFAVPPAVQPDLAVKAARRDKAMLLGKPMAGDLAGAEDMTIEVDNAGVVSQLALTWRYAFAVREFLNHGRKRTRALGGAGRVVSGTMADSRSAAPWRLERGVLLELGPDLVDLLETALGRVTAIRAHGDPHGWFGLLLEHEEGRFSEASMCATAAVDQPVAQVEIFGSGGAAEVDCVAAVGPETYTTMFREFADAIDRDAPHELDVHRGLRLQQLLEAADTDLLAGR
jgi:predicted dehydrogenase